MGAFLDKPKTKKFVLDGEGNGIKYGISAMQGWRMEMEDSHICATNVPFGIDYSFFGVFDGHAGPKVAQYCSQNLLKCIQDSYEKKPKEEEKGKKEQSLEYTALHDGFIEFDKEMLEKEPWLTGSDRSGSTAIVCLLTPDHIIWGNCGDSRGILCSDNVVNFATVDHKPFNEIERARIEKAGGTVVMQRVNGSLAVSRALGDFDYKRTPGFISIDQLVSPEPDVKEIERQVDKDQFLLLACDGIFDVMSNEEVVKFVLHQLTLSHELSDICSSLIDMCLHKNSRDNMSVVLVTFPSAPTVSSEAIQQEEIRRSSGMEIITAFITAAVNDASDSMEVEEAFVMESLSKHLAEEHNDFEDIVYSQRKDICALLEEKRKAKFGKENSEGFGEGLSDPADAPREFDSIGSDRITFSEDRVITVPPPPLTVASSDTDTAVEDKDSATIM